MARLLARAGEYCARLSQASLDFVCLEDISERTQDKRAASPTVSRPGRPPQDEILAHRYLYDYQFINKDGQKTEKRRLLEFDGVKVKDPVDALVTRTFVYQNVLFGAVDLLGASRQPVYRYQLRGREILDEEAVFVIDAVPGPGFPENINQGTIWLRERDAGILKVVWNVKSMESHLAIKETAKRFKGTPRITQVTEFQFEKNGVRFPSRFSIEEAYVDKKGGRRVRATLDVTYRDYKFFTVVIEPAVIK